MSDEFPLPVPPSKNRNVLAIELISGSFGGAAQVIVGQVSDMDRCNSCIGTVLNV